MSDLSSYNLELPLSVENAKYCIDHNWNYYSGVRHDQMHDPRKVFWIDRNRLVCGPKYIQRTAASRMINDFLMAMETRTIPYYEKRGADGIALTVDGEYEDIEYKLCELNLNRFCKGPNGGLKVFSGDPYKVQPKKIGGWTGQSMAKWKVSSGKEYTKDMRTLVGLKLEQLEEWTGIWSLTGEQVLESFKGQPNEKNISIHQVTTNGKLLTGGNARFIGLDITVELISTYCSKQIGKLWFPEV
ncbi:hypothetical protein D3C87_1437960 [compost metagenome]